MIIVQMDGSQSSEHNKSNKKDASVQSSTEQINMS